MTWNPERFRILSRVEGIMGKGDKRTRRGKIYNGSHGKARPHKAAQHAPAEKVAAGSPARKATRRRKPA